jgi:ParB-like chromosome segregation protein Spo0J
MTVMLSRDADCGIVEGSINSNLLNLVDELPETSVPVGSLVPGFHLRQDGTSAAHVRLLADAAGSVKLPSILVQRQGLRIIDGLHRVEVAKLRNEWTISARIVDCTDEEALVLAVKSNTLHGLPLTRSDRISSAKRILTAHSDWSDRAVAGITGLSAKSIASLRNSSTSDIQFSGKRLGRDGKRRPVMPGEGRQRATEYIRTHPEASLREVSRETDVSLGTAHDVRERLRREANDPQPAQGAAPGGAAHHTGPTLHPAGRTPDEPAAAAISKAPPSPTSIHRVAGAYNPAGFAWPEISVKLARDPAIRYTEGGRAFLRWMAVHSMQADEWQEFIDAIPQHWVEDVRRIANGMSEEWRQFAERLGHKMVTAS